MKRSVQEHIILEQVSTHNLKGLDVAFPSGKMTVVTGVSGSGKSSLVFDTLYGESYRRYVESLSSFARQYIKAMDKPKIGKVTNLPPAIAVKQARSGATSRSTVGTMTELSDLIRAVFVRLAEITCPGCGQKVEKDTPELVADKVISKFSGQRVMVVAPLSRWRGVKGTELKRQLLAQGFVRVLIGGKLHRLEDLKVSQLKSDARVVVDRIKAEDEHLRRLVDAVTLGFKVGRNRIDVVGDTLEEPFVSSLSCPGCTRDFMEPTLALFSFNHPYGACPTCQGFGMEPVLDENKIIPDRSSSLADGGVAPWNFGKHDRIYNQAKTSAESMGIDFERPFSKYTLEQWRWLMDGDGSRFYGINGYFLWLSSKKHKMHYRIHAARFRKYVTCSDCAGARLNADALSYRILDLNISDVCRLNVASFLDWLSSAEEFAVKRGVQISGVDSDQLGLSEAFSEAKARGQYMLRVGLSYLSLDRTTKTLSGGEQQRINMARCLGSALTDTLYCLDEPSAGLHARDSDRLLGVLFELRDQGNTVVVVEHEQQIIKGADYLIEIGPEAGHRGGELTFSGKPKKTGKKGRKWPISTLSKTKEFIELKSVSTHNLKNVSIRIPAGRITAVCGVSGSGKTSLIQHSLYPALAEFYGSDTEGWVSDSKVGSVGPGRVLNNFSQVVHVSQGALGRSSRSNIATYLGVYDDIRKLLASTPKAKQLGLKPGHFSFNTKGGRCEHCRGLGTVVEDLSFLGDMEVVCPECDGRRFSPEVLSVEIKDKNLSQLLKMTVSEIRELFFYRKGLATILDRVIDMGLGYVTLGQNTSSFSGGEAQRLKLLRLLKDAGRGSGPSILIFDEPTTGLSDFDVANLLEQFQVLTGLGHTVVVVEHHLGLLKSSDWLIEIGPEAADQGGEVVYQGPPAGLIKSERSLTAPYLNEELM